MASPVEGSTGNEGTLYSMTTNGAVQLFHEFDYTANMGRSAWSRLIEFYRKPKNLCVKRTFPIKN